MPRNLQNRLNIVPSVEVVLTVHFVIVGRGRTEREGMSARKDGKIDRASMSPGLKMEENGASNV